MLYFVHLHPAKQVHEKFERKKTTILPATWNEDARARRKKTKSTSLVVRVLLSRAKPTQMRLTLLKFCFQKIMLKLLRNRLINSLHKICHM